MLQFYKIDRNMQHKQQLLNKAALQGNTPQKQIAFSKEQNIQSDNSIYLKIT